MCDTSITVQHRLALTVRFLEHVAGGQLRSDMPCDGRLVALMSMDSGMVACCELQAPAFHCRPDRTEE